MQDLLNTWQILTLPKDKVIELDMGCGKGRFTAELARRYPDRMVLANDIISERLGILERQAKREGLENLHVFRATSLPLVAYQLPPRSIDRMHLLCPDPWPKKRHTCRRLVCTDFLTKVPRVLKQGGIFHLSTDYDPYYEDWLEMFAKLPEIFEPAPEAMEDIADIKTNFELRWNSQGKSVNHIAYRLKI